MLDGPIGAARFLFEIEHSHPRVRWRDVRRAAVRLLVGLERAAEVLRADPPGGDVAPREVRRGVLGQPGGLLPRLEGAGIIVVGIVALVGGRGFWVEDMGIEYPLALAVGGIDIGDHRRIIAAPRPVIASIGP